MELNKIIRSVLFLTAGVVLTSCIEVNGSGYSDLSESEKLHVKKCESSMDSIKNDGNLYKVTVRQVKDCINGYKEAIVYEYLPFGSDNGMTVLNTSPSVSVLPTLKDTTTVSVPAQISLMHICRYANSYGHIYPIAFTLSKARR